MPVYTVVGTQYCAPRSGFLRLRRGPTRTSAARTLRVTSRSKAEAVRMYRKAVGVGRDCELKVYASPESVQPNRRRTSRRHSRRLRPNSRRRSSRHGLSRNYAALVRAGAQGAVRLAQSPAVRRVVTAAAPYAIEVAKTGATALQTKLQAKLHRWGAKEAAAAPAPARVAANRRRTSRRSPRTI